ncbi:unnamed protein product [Merluccius merluccius]
MTALFPGQLGLDAPVAAACWGGAVPTLKELRATILQNKPGDRSPIRGADGERRPAVPADGPPVLCVCMLPRTGCGDPANPH